MGCFLGNVCDRLHMVKYCICDICAYVLNSSHDVRLPMRDPTAVNSPSEVTGQF